MYKKIVIVLLSVLVLTLFFRTGFLQNKYVDSRDINYWEYENGIIKNSGGFEFSGNKDICWLLIHGYSSTPFEMKEIAKRVNSEFEDYMEVIRLRGHGEVPSKLYGLSLDVWYSEVSQKFEEMEKDCGKINIIGSSYGGTLALKLSNEEDFNNLYIVNGYVKPSYRFYHLLDLNTQIYLFSNSLGYLKKNKIAEINDPRGRENHIAYWNFVLEPVKDSQGFIENISCKDVDENLLIQHSRNDKVSNPKDIQMFYECSSSFIKEIKWFIMSNHILLMDYDKQDVIQNIIDFEKKNRNLSSNG